MIDKEFIKVTWICNYCGKQITNEEQNIGQSNVTADMYMGDESGNNRYICIKCMIKIYDKILGKPKYFKEFLKHKRK